MWSRIQTTAYCVQLTVPATCVNASLVYGQDCVGGPRSSRWLRVQDIENWYLTGDTKKPDDLDPTIQIGWFQVLRGYLTHQWNIL
jgi:hypothetical protein